MLGPRLRGGEGFDGLRARQWIIVKVFSVGPRITEDQISCFPRKRVWFTNCSDPENFSSTMFTIMMMHNERKTPHPSTCTRVHVITWGTWSCSRGCIIESFTINCFLYRLVWGQGFSYIIQLANLDSSGLLLFPWMQSSLITLLIQCFYKYTYNIFKHWILIFCDLVS